MLLKRNGIIFKVEGWDDKRSGFGILDGLLEQDDCQLRLRVIEQEDTLLPSVIIDSKPYEHITIPAKDFEAFLMGYIEKEQK